MSKDWILVSTGKKFYPARPEQNFYDIEDICSGLCAEHRFAGQTKRFISVARHSVSVSIMVEEWGARPEVQLQALLHDATEAYIKDIPKPVKDMLPEYAAIEKGLQDAIMTQFGLPTELDRQVKKADKHQLVLEAIELYPDSLAKREWLNCYDLVDDIKLHLIPGRSIELIKRLEGCDKELFMERYRALTGLIRTKEVSREKA